ncbi:MAG: FAD-dependent oxidoreductase [Clostridia bacterium]|nr:FAD-dependent oxidoreductase [Clostridia bacterium]MBO5913509.1 FAD-dependent oxidoreductase [Clostridia bacterium]
MKIIETIETNVYKSCDVLVCGGGFGGISAALAAARQGKKVVLLEKQFILGGLGTAGIVTIYLPLCDGVGHQVSFGICEELFRLSVSMGSEARYPENWLDSDDVSKRTEKDKRFEVQYNPNLFSMLVEKLLIENGVEILYGTYAVAVSKSDDKINAVVIENKSGRQAISVKSVVDATGDADIVKFANAPSETFKQGNVLAAWYYSYGKDGYKLRNLGFCDIPDEQKTENNKVETLVNRRFSGLDGQELSEQTIMSHTSTLNDIFKRRVDDPTIVPTMIAITPQIRMTRRIDGEYVLDDKEVHTYFDDSIGMVSDWRKRGPIYEVPFRTLYSKVVKNLICAGRCTSVTDPMWDIMRVIPCCAVTGEAAGTAAAMTDDFSTLDVCELQKKLVENGVVLHEKDL